MTAARAEFAVTGALMRRAINEVVRVPGAAIPAILAPSIFMLGLTAVFGNLSQLPGFSADDYMTFLIPVSLMQSGAFTGAATGVNLARDIELGWFDRMLVSPASRRSLLAGLILSASFRSLMPMTLLIVVGLSLDVPFPGVGDLLVSIAIAAAFAAVAASWGVSLALRFKTQSAAPLMQAGMFMAVLFTTSYAPQELLTGWLAEVARINPVTHVLEAVRQGFTGQVTWAETWPGLVALVGLGLVLVGLALRALRRATA